MASSEHSVANADPLPTQLRFGPFEVNTSTGELWKNGIRLRLAGQPLAILLRLLRTPGDVVTRDQLREEIWGDRTFVDFEHGLNAAVNKLRRTLSDSADKPRYVETIPGQGYKFVGILECPAPSPPRTQEIPTSPVSAPPQRRTKLWFFAAGFVGVALMMGMYFRGPSEAPQWQFTRLTPEGENADSPALSRDGSLFAYSLEKDGMRDLYIQHVAGGPPVRLTTDGAGNTSPNFSPDNSKIVFRSEREGGGIYEIATLGGEAHLLARGGLDPKFSPDGTQIAFWIGSTSVMSSIPGSGTVWVMAANGGQPRQVGTGLSAARHPIWSPDGRQLLAIGYGSNQLWQSSSLDWWTITLADDRITKTGLRDRLLARGLPQLGIPEYSRIEIPEIPSAACWLPDSNKVIFSASTGDAFSLWAAPFSPEGTADGPVEQLTAGTANELQAACGFSGTFVFARKTYASNVWSVSFDGQHAKPTGPPVRVTNRPSLPTESASLSGDAQSVAFTAPQSGVLNVPNIWLHHIGSGEEKQIAPSRYGQRFPLAAPAGDRVVYSSYEGDKRVLYIAAPGSAPEKLCDGCIRPTDWSRDGQKLLTFIDSPYKVALLDVATHRLTPLLSHPAHNLLLAHFSPDNRWISFTERVAPNRADILIAPISGPLPVPQASWIKISEDNDVQDAAIWAPDGQTLLFTSSRDGHICLWGRRMDAETHQPKGAPFPVQHFHEHPMSSLRQWSAARDRIAVTLSENTGSIWLMSRLASVKE